MACGGVATAGDRSVLSPLLGTCAVALGLLIELQGSQEADVPPKLFSELSSGKEGDLGKERERMALRRLQLLLFCSQ